MATRCVRFLRSACTRYVHFNRWCPFLFLRAVHFVGAFFGVQFFASSMFRVLRLLFLFPALVSPLFLIFFETFSFFMRLFLPLMGPWSLTINRRTAFQCPKILLLSTRWVCSKYTCAVLCVLVPVMSIFHPYLVHQPFPPSFSTLVSFHVFQISIVYHGEVDIAYFVSSIAPFHNFTAMASCCVYGYGNGVDYTYIVDTGFCLL